MTTQQIVKWAGGFVVGVGTIIWLYGTFLTKAEHINYINSHDKWGQQVLSDLREDLNEYKVDTKELKTGQTLILRKLDNIETRIMIKGKEGVFKLGIHTNDLKATAFLLQTNLFE